VECVNRRAGQDRRVSCGIVPVNSYFYARVVILTAPWCDAWMGLVYLEFGVALTRILLNRIAKA